MRRAEELAVQRSSWTGRSDAEGRCREPDAALLYLEAGAWAEEATKVVRRERIGLRYLIMRIYTAE